MRICPPCHPDSTTNAQAARRPRARRVSAQEGRVAPTLARSPAAHPSRGRRRDDSVRSTESSLRIKDGRRQPRHRAACLGSSPHASLSGQGSHRTGLDGPRRTDLLAGARHPQGSCLAWGLAEIAFFHLARSCRQLGRAERAGPCTEPASDALVRIDSDESVLRALADCRNRACRLAWGIAAMHAGHRDVHGVHVGVRPRFDLDHLAPARPDLHFVPGLAGDFAGVALHAALVIEIEPVLQVVLPSGVGRGDLPSGVSSAQDERAPCTRCSNSPP
jgi:hypothetical protein